MEFEGRSARVRNQTERSVNDFEEGPLAFGTERGVDARADRNHPGIVEADTQRSTYRETAFDVEISGSRGLEDSAARSIGRELDARSHHEQSLAGRIVHQAAIGGLEVEEQCRVCEAARESRKSDHRGRIAPSLDRQPAAGAVALRHHDCRQRGIHHLHAHGGNRATAGSGEGAQIGAADGQKVRC